MFQVYLSYYFGDFAFISCICGRTFKISIARNWCPAQREVSRYLVSNYQTPEDYVIGKLKDHDIVFIGEYHRIKQNVELIHTLIPRLYEDGVYNLGIEFALRQDQQKIDKLITADTYDEELAGKILFSSFAFWGYQEYADIFKVAWNFNRRLPEGSRRFRVFGLGVKADWSHVKTKEDRDKPEIMRKVWANGRPDSTMANTIIQEFINKKEKALIYAGSHHAFTKYKQPIYNESTKRFVRFVEDRMGNLVYNVIGERAFNIFLHSPWVNEKGYREPYVYPVDGAIDALMVTLPLRYQNAGFDTKGSPFGDLPGTTALYKYGYDNFTLSDFCDGYIYQCPLSEYTGVTPIEEFVNEYNLAEAKSQCPNPWFKNPSVTAEDFNEAIKTEVNIERRFRRYW